MADPRLTWIPKGEGSTFQVDLDKYGERGLQRLRGWRETDLALQVGSGGAPVGVVHDAWFVYDLRFDAVHRIDDWLTWQRLSNFTAHVQGGGLFSFAIDSGKTLDTALNGAVVKGATSITLDAATGVENFDKLLIEDAADPTRWQTVRVTDISAAPTLTVTALGFGFADNTPVWAFEYFENCVVEGRRPVEFFERDAGRGADLWDFRLRFRTVRG